MSKKKHFCLNLTLTTKFINSLIPRHSCPFVPNNILLFIFVVGEHVLLMLFLAREILPRHGSTSWTLRAVRNSFSWRTAALLGSRGRASGSVCARVPCGKGRGVTAVSCACHRSAWEHAPHSSHFENSTVGIWRACWQWCLSHLAAPEKFVRYTSSMALSSGATQPPPPHSRSHRRLVVAEYRRHEWGVLNVTATLRWFGHWEQETWQPKHRWAWTELCVPLRMLWFEFKAHVNCLFPSFCKVCWRLNW